MADESLHDPSAKTSGKAPEADRSERERKQRATTERERLVLPRRRT